jgi:RNA polymerase sigma factor (sigma-70 family)
LSPHIVENSIDQSWAAKLYKEHSEFIRLAIRYHLNDENLADDVFQDFFLHLSTYPHGEEIINVRAFLYRAIANFILTVLQQKKTYLDHLHRFAEESRVRNSYLLDESTVVSQEAEKVFTIITALLPERESVAICERFKNDRNISEVARRMNVNTRSVSRYISNGLRRIHNLLLIDSGD